MKLAAIALCVLGVFAAVCAAFLVSTLRASTAPQPLLVATTMQAQPMVQVLYATAGIPAMTVVDAKSVIVKSVPKNEVPADYISSPVDVVGKVVGVPVVEGQAFTNSCFADKPTARQVADAIPFGKRAVGISVTDYAGLEGMLFPGSTVDVMASFKPEGGDWQNAVSATLLENIQVLGIEQQTVVSPNKPIADAGLNVGHNSSRRVTLLVTTEQAKVLQLAMEHGILSLALRNPLDAGKSENGSVSVKKLLNDLSPLQLPDLKSALDKLAAATAAANAANAANVSKTDPFAGAAAPPKPADPPPAPHWDVQIIRNTASETKSMPVSKSGSGNADAISADR